MKEKNNTIGKNIEFCTKKMYDGNLNVYGLAKQYEKAPGEPKNRRLVYQWIAGDVIPRKSTIMILEDIFKLPHGALSDPFLKERYDVYMLLYDCLHSKPLEFDNGEDFLKEWKRITDYAQNHPDEGIRVNREFVNEKDIQDKTKESFLLFLKSLDYKDYDISSIEFDDLFEGTKQYIANKHKRNRAK